MLLLASGGIPMYAHFNSCLGTVLFQIETDSQLGCAIRFIFIALNSGTLNNIEQCFSILAISMLTGKFWELNSTWLKGAQRIMILKISNDLVNMHDQCNNRKLSLHASIYECIILLVPD